MLKSLLALLRLLTRAPILEAIGAALVVYGVYLLAGTAGAVIAGGVALMLKALELDQAREAGR